MMDFLKQLFGGATSSAPRSATPAEAKQRPPIPADVMAEFQSWFLAHGVPMEFLAQLDLADRASLGIGPSEGVVQFFIGRDDLFGADFDNLLQGQ